MAETKVRIQAIAVAVSLALAGAAAHSASPSNLRANLGVGKAKLSDDGPHALKRADGVRVPGVGTVLRLAGLVDLRDVPADILARAAERGAMVHRYLEWIYDGQGGLDASSIVPELVGYVAAWWRFIADTGFMVESVEQPLVWDCGAVEQRALADLPGGDPPAEAWLRAAGLEDDGAWVNP